MFHYLRREAGFYRRLVRLALPLILQNLITTSLGFVDTFMVGLLGQTSCPPSPPPTPRSFWYRSSFWGSSAG